jgi:ATP-dependent DNA helicase DinG
MKESILKSGGPISFAFDNYTERDPQIKMERACLDLKDGESLIVEAPTGTGKSLAYLSAAIRERRTIVVTANIALQEQIVKKDLPMIREHVEDPFTFTIRKGVSNYICHQKVEENVADIPRDLTQFYNKSVGNFELQDLSNLERQHEKSYLLKTDRCEARTCHFKDICQFSKIREESSSANVVVTNYHMFFANVLAQGAVLGDYDLVIFDEAHKMESIARSVLGGEVGEIQIRRLLKQFNFPLFGRTLPSLNDSSSVLIQDLSPNEQLFIRSDFKLVLQRLSAEIEKDYLEQDDIRFHGIGSHHEVKEIQKIERRLERYLGLRSKIQTILSGMDGEVENKAIFVERDGANSFRFKFAPLDVSKFLNIKKKAIYTSATIGDFKRFAKRCGVEDPKTLRVNSPFNYRENSMFIIPDEMPKDPNSKIFQLEASNVIAELDQIIDGGILVLTTSNRNLRALSEAYRGGRTKLVQGEAPRTKLIEAMKADGRAILFGTESFWAGVDIQGTALQCVVVDRIPFPPPNDPVLESMKRQGVNTFADYVIPDAKVQLAQGIGRLIRTTEDFGVVVLLDKRLQSKRYGKQILNYIKPSNCFLSPHLDKIHPFFIWREKQINT